MGWIVRWRALEERFASTWEALDRWEQLDALGREPELFEVSADGCRTAISGLSHFRDDAARPPSSLERELLGHA